MGMCIHFHISGQLAIQLRRRESLHAALNLFELFKLDCACGHTGHKGYRSISPICFLQPLACRYRHQETLDT